jgi:hypothetical protein
MSSEPSLERPASPMTPPPENSTLSIVSLVSGLLGWFLLPFIGAIAAIITGHMAKAEIRDSMGSLGGDGLATAGLVLGYVQIVFCIVPLCVIFILAMMGPSIGNIFSNIILNI